MPQTAPARACRRRTRGPAAAAPAVAGLAIALLVAGCGVSGTAPGTAATSPTQGSPTQSSPTQGSPASTTGSTPSVSGPPTSLAPSATRTPTTTAPTTAPTTGPTKAAAKPPAVLRPGDRGPFVLALQRRLAASGYWVGTPDGAYGNQTSQAVLALQKAAGLARDGVLGPKTSAALASTVRPTARTRSGSAIEVDKKRQLVLVVVQGRVRLVLNTSTGSGQPYTSDGEDYVAVTPRGRYRIQRQIDGLRVSRLGELWRPKYFFEGYALHGAPSVPGYPASHGCVRLSNAAIDMLWSSGLAPIGRTVWVY